MKVHITSLQRTGSKSLYNAIHKALPNPWTFSNGDQLGEFLHCWSYYGYKFGQGATKPFDQKAEIMFWTNQDFHKFEGRNFDVEVTRGGLLQWAPHAYAKTLGMHDVMNRLAVVRVSPPGTDVVVKTQYTSLTEELHFGSYERRSLFNDISGAFDKTIFLVPDDLIRWVCSNYVSDYTGVFVACPEQEQAAEKLQKEKLFIPEIYVNQMLQRYMHFVELRTSRNGLVLHTSELDSPDTAVKLMRYLGVPVVIEHQEEFSAFDYATMILNYDQIQLRLSEYS